MLPSELLAVWKRKGQIQPKYAPMTSENLKIARVVIKEFKDHIGDKKKNLKSALSDLEEPYVSYRFVRGLATILERKSLFRCKSGVDPERLRMQVFRIVDKNGIPTTSEDRRIILELAAESTGLTVDEIEENLYADLDSELILQNVGLVSEMDLLREYNLGLTQTLIFDSTELTFSASGNWQNLFRQIKRLGLIYDAFNEGGIWVKIDGPASLFRLTRRYGTLLAKLIPFIVSNLEWKIEAKILWKYTNEILSLSLDSQHHGNLLKKIFFSDPEFDSEIEEKFSRQFEALKTNWVLKREPEPLIAQNNVLIPDFSLQNSGLKIYVEIMGFWTESYLKRKISKLTHINEEIVLLVNESLACEKLGALQRRPTIRTIYYKNKVPLGKLLTYLDERFKEIKEHQIEVLRQLPIKISRSLVRYSEFATQRGTSIEAVSEVLKEKTPSGYVALSNMLISEEILNQINQDLGEASKCEDEMSLSNAVEIVEKYVEMDVTDILEHLGYKIIWQGINVNQAKISIRRNSKND